MSLYTLPSVRDLPPYNYISNYRNAGVILEAFGVVYSIANKAQGHT